MFKSLNIVMGLVISLEIVWEVNVLEISGNSVRNLLVQH